MNNKKRFLALMAAATVLGSASVQAKKMDSDSSSDGNLEISGNINVLAGYQKDNFWANPGGAEGSVINALDGAGAGMGMLGDFRGPAASDRDTFNFYLDQAEVDFSRVFGENIRIRLDVDFGRGLSGTLRNVLVEQAYVTANIPVGNGLEVAMGRFNAPVGLESVDRGDNIAVSYSNIFRFLRPHNVTGLKLYYAFNEHIDWSLYAVNNLWDSIDVGGFRDTIVPSGGTRIGFTWGEEGREHNIGLSYLVGPEAAVDLAVIGLGSTGRDDNSLTHIADLDFSFHVTDNFVVAGEFIYRFDSNDVNSGLNNDGSACYIVDDTVNCTGWAGQLVLDYAFGENWDVYGRYEYFNDRVANYTGLDQQIHAGTIGFGYQITEGAKMKLEYRIDIGIPDEGLNNGLGLRDPADGSLIRTYHHGVALSMNYDF